MRRKQTIRKSLLIVVSLALFGCAKPDPLVGTWKSQTRVIEFNQNGSFGAQGLNGETLTGKWKRSGNEVTTHGTKWTGKTESESVDLKDVSVVGFRDDDNTLVITKKSGARQEFIRVPHGTRFE